MLKAESIVGCLLGTAVGDAMGLPYEGLSSGRIYRMTARRIERYRLLPGKGMVSDDTEQTCMVAQALIVSGGEEKKFTRACCRRQIPSGSRGDCVGGF
ncbi:ADP-ribosylglycohydrolase family protein [Lusitaniella coriacea]|uniref:ADP-ribosylglycohydrolase family protein n=1 Tax=Lusitaniella coriacea TaxID=1983105 RepID=UPI003CF99841